MVCFNRIYDLFLPKFGCSLSSFTLSVLNLFFLSTFFSEFSMILQGISMKIDLISSLTSYGLFLSKFMVCFNKIYDLLLSFIFHSLDSEFIFSFLLFFLSTFFSEFNIILHGISIKIILMSSLTSYAFPIDVQVL